MLTQDLYDYQSPPVDQFLGRGSLLVAFDMGLGKTPIGIACAEELLGCDDIDLCMVVCESSLKYQWAQAIAKFTDIPSRKITLRLEGKSQVITVPAEPYGVIIDGKPFQRNKVKYSAADDRKRQYRHSVTPQTDYVIVSYDNCVDDARWVRQIHPGLVILDEATAIKTFSADRTQKIKRILDASYRLALTGTPVDNRAEELFSIMEWVDPEVLGRWDLFEAAYIVRNEYGQVKRYKNLHVMRERLSPAVARVAHSAPEVREFIPEKVVSELRVTPGPKLYGAFLDIAADLLEGLKSLRFTGGFDLAAYYAGHKDENSAAGVVMAMITAADQLLAHPDLLVMSAQEYADSQRRQDRGEQRATWPGSKYAWTKWQQGLVDDVWESPKIKKLAKRVPKILAEDPAFKVLVYTRFPGALSYIEEALGLPCVKYHGGMSPKAKAAAQARFTEDPLTRVFLSSHAGARGVDLFTGSHLINFDLPWAPGLADQINGRHVRASSKFKQVFVENMVTTGTTEEWKRDVVTFKRRVGTAILDGKGADRFGGVENDVQSLTGFLTGVLSDA